LPPHVHKTYRGSRYLRLLASVASKRLFQASEIVVIGYSFPAFDFEALSMFRASRLEPWELGESEDYLEQLVVVNPSVTSRRWVERLESLFGLDRASAHGRKVKLTTHKSVADYLRK
jgi:hypothetical protein